MQEEQYTNREIREMMSDIKLALARIETQTLRTNGRVSTLEIWRGYQTGAIAVIVLMGLPILGWVIIQVVDIIKVIR